MLAYLLCYGLEIKDKPRKFSLAHCATSRLSWCLEQHGVCRALSYIIQTLSADPAFGNKLTSPIRIPIPSKWSIPGSAADFMVTVRDFRPSARVV